MARVRPHASSVPTRLTGAQVVERLRADGIDTPIVFVTAALEIHQLATALGLRCALSKPFDPDVLLRLLTVARAGGC